MKNEGANLRKRYNLSNNVFFVLKRMANWGNGLLAIQILGIALDTAELFIVPILIKLVIQCIEMGNNLNNVLHMISIYGAVIILLFLMQGFVLNQIKWRMGYVLIRFKRELTNTMMSMDYSNLESSVVLDEHEKIRNVMNDRNPSIEGMMNSSIRFGKFGLQILISAILLMELNPFLVGMLLVILVVSSIPVEYAKKIDKAEVWDALGPYWRKHFNMGFLTTKFNVAKEIRLYDMKEWIYRKYLRINGDIQKKYIHSRNIWFKSHSIVACLQLFQEICLYVFLIFRILQGNLSIANFTLYIASARIFSRAVNDFLLEFADIKKQSSEVSDFRRFVDAYSIDCNELGELNEKKIDVVFQDVSIVYEGQTKKALSNVNITIPYGQRLAIVGLNGAGKTSFIKLLCGLYQPSEGKILLNGKTATDFEKTSIYKMFSPVFQNVEVYPFTIAENVSMTLLEDTNYERLDICLKQCGLYEIVERQKYKEKTQVLKVLDSEGTDLSGGEKQKLALARALYKDSPIIILDEPTAALDPLAEEKLYVEFDKLIGEKTGIYISHRLSSTRFCDVIAMFKNGELIEYGTHRELMALHGEYYSMFEAQAQYYRNEEVIADGCL